MQPAELSPVTVSICTAVACSPAWCAAVGMCEGPPSACREFEDDTRLELRDSPYTHPLRNVGASYTRVLSRKDLRVATNLSVVR